MRHPPGDRCRLPIVHDNEWFTTSTASIAGMESRDQCSKCKIGSRKCSSPLLLPIVKSHRSSHKHQVAQDSERHTCRVLNASHSMVGVPKYLVLKGLRKATCTVCEPQHDRCAKVPCFKGSANSRCSKLPCFKRSTRRDTHGLRATAWSVCQSTLF